MKIKSIIKHYNNKRFEPAPAPRVEEKKEAEKTPIVKKNKNSKKSTAMTNEDMTRAEILANELTPEQTTKRLKKDKGLIERVESSKVMLTEDNKQLLVD